MLVLYKQYYTRAEVWGLKKRAQGSIGDQDRLLHVTYSILGAIL